MRDTTLSPSKDNLKPHIALTIWFQLHRSDIMKGTEGTTRGFVNCTVPQDLHNTQFFALDQLIMDYRRREHPIRKNVAYLTALDSYNPSEEVVLFVNERWFLICKIDASLLDCQLL
jgi:hypothetical protein